jgi:hypothetical protein
MKRDRTQRRAELRCQSHDHESEGRTHYCRLTTPHPSEDHQCICLRSWPEAVSA